MVIFIPQKTLEVDRLSEVLTKFKTKLHEIDTQKTCVIHSYVCYVHNWVHIDKLILPIRVWAASYRSVCVTGQTCAAHSRRSFALCPSFRRVWLPAQSHWTHPQLLSKYNRKLDILACRLRELVAQLGTQECDSRPQLTQISDASRQHCSGGAWAPYARLLAPLAGHHLVETPQLQCLETVRFGQLQQRLTRIDEQPLHGRRHLPVDDDHWAAAPALGAHMRCTAAGGCAIATSGGASGHCCCVVAIQLTIVLQALAAQDVAAAGHIPLRLAAKAVSTHIAEDSHCVNMFLSSSRQIVKRSQKIYVFVCISNVYSVNHDPLKMFL